MKKSVPYDKYAKAEMERIEKQKISGYLSKKKIKDMQPTELIVNLRLIEEEIETRGLDMLFGV